jgi:hypothetical protein
VSPRSLVIRRLDGELRICRKDRSIMRPGVRISRRGTDVLVRFEQGRDGRPGVFLLDCRSFDAQPPSVAMLDPDSGAELPMEGWIPGVPHSVHPVTGKPFVCLQGVAEYHLHPSHLDDPWDRYRNRYRLPETIRRLLDKAGVAP